MSLIIVTRNLTGNPIRSILSVVGVAIGVSAVIGLLSISLGLSKSVNDQVSNFGQNTLMVTPGAGFMSIPFKNFDESDLSVLEGISGVERVVPRYITVVPAEFRKDTFDVRIAGIRTADLPYTIQKAKVFSLYDGNLFDTDNEVVLGKTMWRDLDKPGIGQSITINNTRFKIVGIFNAVGMPFMDSVVFMDLDNAQSLKGEYYYNMFSVFVIDPSVADRITDKLKRHRGDEDFTVMTNKQMEEQVGQILVFVNAFLLSITGVSLIVGAMGIANTMFVSISERISQIGVMKTLGATNDRVAWMVMEEAAVLGLVGGVAGILFGKLLGDLVVYIASLYNVSLSSYIPTWIAGATILGTIVLGVISGLIPALQASKLDPIEALKL